MKQVYLIRHALPDFPGGKRMCIGTTDIPLGKEGFAQAREMAQKLPSVSAVFSSPLTRAAQTAEAIGMPVTVVEGLREMYAGEWDGLTFEEIKMRYPALYAARGENPGLPLPGEEDREQALIRFQAAMEEAAGQSPGDFAVIAHGGIIAEFMKALTGKRQKPGYAQIVLLVWDNGIFSAQ